MILYRTKKGSTVTASREHPKHTITRNITFFKKVTINVQEQGDGLTFGDFEEEISSDGELNNEDFNDNDMLFQADQSSHEEGLLEPAEANGEIAEGEEEVLTEPDEYERVQRYPSRDRQPPPYLAKNYDMEVE